MPVAGRGWESGQAQADRYRGAENVSARGDDGGREVAVVDVDGRGRVLPQPVQ